MLPRVRQLGIEALHARIGARASLWSSVGAGAPERQYLLRWGVLHLIQGRELGGARSLLLDVGYFAELGSSTPDEIIARCWALLGERSPWPCYEAALQQWFAHESPAATLAATRALASLCYDQAWGSAFQALKVAIEPRREEWLALRHPDVVTLFEILSLACSREGDSEGAIAVAQLGLEASLRINGVDHPATLTMRRILANERVDRGEVSDGLADAEAVWEDAERILGRDHLTTLSALDALANAHYEGGNPSRALSLREKALESRLRVQGVHNPDAHVVMYHVGGLRRVLGDLEGAHEILEECAIRSLGTRRADHSAVLGYIHMLAEVCSDLGRYEDAELWSRTMIEAITKGDNNAPAWLARAQACLGSALWFQDRFGESEAALREARAGLTAVGAHCDCINEVDFDLGGVLWRQEKWDEATDCYVRFVTNSDDEPAARQRVGRAAGRIGLHWSRTGRQREALAMLRAAVVALSGTCGPDHEATSAAKAEFERCLTAQGTSKED